MKNFAILVVASSISMLGLAQGNPLGSFIHLPLYVGKKPAPMLNYSDIKGSCFFNEKFRAATGVTKGGDVVSIPLAKLNLFSNEVLYAEEQVEYTASADQFQQLILLGSTELQTNDIVFETQKVDGADVFLQVMNSGDLKLLKRRHIELMRGDYDPMLGRSDFRFFGNDQFYLEEGNMLVRIKKLNRKSVAAVFKLSASMEEWLAMSKNSLETESEVIAFLNFCNNSHVKP